MKVFFAGTLWLSSVGIKDNLLIDIDFQSYRNWSILHNKEKGVCYQCGEKLAKYENLIRHARHTHRHPIVKCNECGKEFVHEKDRDCITSEKNIKKKVENRQLKNLNQREK